MTLRSAFSFAPGGWHGHPPHRGLVELYKEGYTPEMLLDQFPTLTLALIHKVIGFCLDNQADVDAYVARCREEIDRQAAAPRQGPDHAELRRRMESLRTARGA